MMDAIAMYCFRSRKDTEPFRVAQAMRQPVDAFKERKTAEQYVKDHYEFERALRHQNNI
jgi:hypothetical protein